MPDGVPNQAADPKRRLLLLWAITATVAAVAFANCALLLWVRAHQAASAQPAHPYVTSPFLSLTESEVIGRYNYFEGTTQVGFIQLLPDHTIINKDGTTYPQYRWEILRDGLLTVWQKSSVTFKVIEKPGTYVALRDDGTVYRRIEKIE
jgi:hypothetical protein